MSDVTFGGIARQFVNEKLTTPEKMQQALNSSQDSKTPLVSYLVTHKIIAARDIAALMSKNFGDPVFDLNALSPSVIPKDLVDEKIVRQFGILPIFQRGGRLYVGMSDPTRLDAIDAVKFGAKTSVEAVVVEEDKLQKLIESTYGGNEAFGDFNAEDFDLEADQTSLIKEDEDDTSGIDDAPVVRYVNKLLFDAIRMGASDLHFEPYEKSYRVRYRIDGVMREASRSPVQMAGKIAARLKVMSQMDISERRIPQDGRIKLKVSKEKAIDFRVNSLPTLFGEKIVLRILDPSSAMLGIDALGYEPEQKALFMDALDKPQGMLLITGPTGSGKTVSLYTGLNILNTIENNISTAEDPVEINLEGINQVNVNAKVGLTFPVALKSFLRQDPDIIMVGEIRDLETAEIAVKAAQTGHMVMSTLHTNSAPETLTRLRNMGVPSFNIATSVNLVIAQRLARRLCPSCKIPVKIPDEVTEKALLELGFTQADLEQGFTLYKPVGCSECREGYRGRVGIYEVMKVTPEIARIIMEDGNAIAIADASARSGFDNLRRSGLRKVMQGLTSLQEINRVTSGD